MTTKKPPVHVGAGIPVGNDPNLARYREDIERRNAERQAKRPVGPDIAAAVAYDPRRDGRTTMEKIGAVHRSLEEKPAMAEEKKPAFSDATLSGLAALKAATEQQLAAATPAPKAEAPKAELPPEKRVDEPKKPEESKTSEPDDLQIDRILGLTALRDRNDVINNDRERDAADARAGGVDVMQGILNGEYTQVVPVVPGKLDVTYRTVSPAEDQAIRLYIFKLTSTDGRYESVATELYALLTLTCGLVQLNGERLPAHYTREGYAVKVNEDILGAKLNLVLGYPLPLLHALSTHQFWFDQRVRKAFTTVDLGNG